MSVLLVDRPDETTAVLTLNRPERRNSMAFDAMVPLHDAIVTLGRDNTCRAVVITGAGPAFCSGADLEDPGTMPNVAGLTPSTIALRAMELLDEIVRAMRRLHQPVIAAVNGPAIGGGFCLAMAADIRIAANGAVFRAAGINNGLTGAELGLSYLLPRAVGITRATEIMLTGRDVDAEEAERIGIVSAVVDPDDLLPTALGAASRIAGFSRPGIELTKRALRNSQDAASFDAHIDAEGVAQLLVRMTTRNFEEAVAARKEGRDPAFAD